MLLVLHCDLVRLFKANGSPHPVHGRHRNGLKQELREWNPAARVTTSPTPRLLSGGFTHACFFMALSKRLLSAVKVTDLGS